MYSIDNPENLDEELLEKLENEETYSEGERDRLSEIYGKDSPENEQKRELSIVWDRYKQFSPEFLEKYDDFVLCDVFHHIKACLLFPPNCSCKPTCRCLQLREKIALTLNVREYTNAQRFEPANRLRAMKNLCYIPEDQVFREWHVDAYPLWAIKKEWKAREKKGDFADINQLVWAFLRLGETSKFCYGVPEASLSEAIEMIVGDTPIKTKVLNRKNAKPIRGEKNYERLFKHYQSVLHFIAALEYCKKEIPTWKYLFVNTIYSPLLFTERLLKLSHWFRKNLLLLERRNVKDRVFLRQEDLYPLPDWVESQDIEIPVEPYEERVKAIIATAKLIDPVTKLVIKEGPEIFS